MENYNNISDKDLNHLLKQRLLQLEDDALLEAEAKLVFSSMVVVAPDVKKEEAFLKKIKKTKGRFWKWLFPGMSILVGVVALFYFYQRSTKHATGEAVDREQPLASGVVKADHSDTEEYTTAASSNENLETFSKKQPKGIASAEENEHDTINTTLKPEHLGIYEGQLLRDVKGYGHSSSPVIMNDSIIVLVYSPAGRGNDAKMSSSAEDDEQYFGNEHNTVWFKFSVKENCKLAFDIMPGNEADNFDFMLFQYNGPNFSFQMRNKRIAPVRTCISKNDVALKSKTGLNYDEQAPGTIHSGAGPSYAKYVRAKEGQIFYLAVDSKVVCKSSHGVKKESQGYTIRLHYKKDDTDELYVGKVIFNKMHFDPNAYVFLPNLGYQAGIDSIYYFLKSHPKIEVEIQGDVNLTELRKESNEKIKSREPSENIAKAVFKCLVAKGIDPLRIVPKGYRDTRKKIWNPKTIAERSKYVSVDIVIISLDYEADQKLMGQRTDQK